MEKTQEYEVKYIAEGTDPLSALKPFSTSAEAIERFADLVTKEIEEGRVNALKVKVSTKKAIIACERIDEKCKAHYNSEAAKYGDKPFIFDGVEVHLTSVKTDYDFSFCGDPIWNRRKKIVDDAIQQLKEREAELKAYHQPHTEVDEATGEIANIRPPLKRQVEGIKIKIK